MRTSYAQYIVQYILDNLHAAVLFLVWRIHQNFSNTLFRNPFAGLFGSCVQLLKVGLAILVN